MIPYLLHASILLAGCFVFYWLFIRQETFFKLNRWVLVSGILLSISIPLIQIPESWSMKHSLISELETAQSRPQEELPNLIPVSTEQDIKNEVSKPPKDTEKEAIVPISKITKKPQTVASGIPLSTIVWYAYLVGVLVFFLAFMVQLIILLTKMYSYLSFRDGPFRIVELVKDEAPYSFWNSIFVNPTKYDLETYTQIIDHEKIHISQVHFFDKILAEILLIAFWFNPFVWLLRNAITNNLEYLTDNSMLKNGAEKQRYQLSLLQVSVPQHPLNLSTNYNNSFLKNRIAMMNSKKSSARSSWKYLFLLPMIAFSMVCLNEVQSKKPTVLSDAESKQSLLLDSIPKTTTTTTTTTTIKSGDNINSAPTNSSAIQNNKVSESNLLSYTNTAKPSNSTITTTTTTYYADCQPCPSPSPAPHSTLRPGHWVGEIDGNKVCFEFNNSQPAKGWTSINTECFKKSELSDLPIGEDKDFFIKREAGTMNFNGSFKKDFGDGTFEFNESTTFKNYLKTKGFGTLKEQEVYHLFLNNVNKDYISVLQSKGLKTDGQGLVELSIHGIDKDQIHEFVSIFDDLDYKGYKVRDLIQFKIHDVDAAYVNEVRASGMKDFSAQEIVQAKIHDVDPEFIKSINAYGFKDLDIQDVIQFSIHDVDMEYIDEMKQLGFRSLSHQDIIQSSIHDVDPGYIKSLHDAGFSEISMQELIQFSIHDIDAEYIQAFKKAGLSNLSQQDIIQAGIHDVDADFIKELKDYGLEGLELNQIIQLSIHDVDVNYLKEMKALGFRDLEIEEIMQAKIHDVDPDYIKGLQAQGLGDMNMQEIIQFNIHDIDPKDIKAFKAAGFDLDTQEIIQAGIHDVSTKYIEQMRALGFKEADLDDFIHAHIHGVNPSYVKKAREKGHNLKTLEEYIRLRIGGM